MKKLILLSAFISMSVATLSAQLMIRGGVNYSDIAIDAQTDDVVFDSKPGFHAGLNGNIPLGPVFSLRPAALYQFKGAEGMSGGTMTDVDLHYLEVPLNLGLTLGPIVLEGGPYLGYLLNSDTGIFNDDSFEKTDWGANFGAVVEISNVGIGLNYSNSLSNIAKEDRLGAATELKNGNLAAFLYIKL